MAVAADSSAKNWRIFGIMAWGRPGLFQLRGDRTEGGLELRPKAVHNRDDGKGGPGSNQAAGLGTGRSYTNRPISL
jgi:hypothetical protein